MINVEKEQFLLGLKNQAMCTTYAVKFKNTYTKYIENEAKSRQDFIYECGIREDEFLARYGEDWEVRWFYLGEDIIYFSLFFQRRIIFFLNYEGYFCAPNF